MVPSLVHTIIKISVLEIHRDFPQSGIHITKKNERNKRNWFSMITSSYWFYLPLHFHLNLNGIFVNIHIERKEVLQTYNSINCFFATAPQCINDITQSWPKLKKAAKTPPINQQKLPGQNAFERRMQDANPLQDFYHTWPLYSDLTASHTPPAPE